jgi:hypothetical protein
MGGQAGGVTDLQAFSASKKGFGPLSDLLLMALYLD